MFYSHNLLTKSQLLHFIEIFCSCRSASFSATFSATFLQNVVEELVSDLSGSCCHPHLGSVCRERVVQLGRWGNVCTAWGGWEQALRTDVSADCGQLVREQFHALLLEYFLSPHWENWGTVQLQSAHRNVRAARTKSTPIFQRHGGLLFRPNSPSVYSRWPHCYTALSSP